MTERMPIDYPWSPAPHTGLLSRGDYLQVEPRRGRRFGLAHVLGLRDTPTSMGQFLLESNAATIDSRILVVAVGSNASPDVIFDKFSSFGHSTSLIVPFIKCTIRGIAVGHSAHVSKRGYIAASPYALNGAETELWASWLDDAQRLALDQTEPNYKRILVSSSDYPLALENQEAPEFYYLYESIHGVLSHDHEPFPLTSQTELFEKLTTASGAPEIFGQAPAEVTRALTIPSTQAKLEGIFRTRKLSEPSHIISSPVDRLSTYGTTASIQFDGREEFLRVLSTDDGLERLGEQCVVLHSKDAMRLALGSHARIQPLVAEDSAFSSRPGMLVRVVRADHVSPGTIHVDQVVRNALGIELQEYARLTSMEAPRTRIGNFLFGSPHYVVCRVHSADLSSVEQEIALIDPIAMRFLGIAQGDVVVLEGVAPTGDSEAASVTIRACELEPEIKTLRSSLTGGGLESRFPSSADALGVYPDLPQIFIDSALRLRLGLGKHKLGTVRIRASRRHQLLSQFREVLLILVLAFIGVLSLFNNLAVVIVSLIVIVGIAMVVVHGRLRGQLGLSRYARRRETDPSRP